MTLFQPHRYCVPVLAACMALSAASGCGRTRAQPGDPAQAIERGWESYRLGEFKRAVEFFDAARAAAPTGSEPLLQALYGLATTWNLRLPAQDQNKQLADQLYHQVLDADPRGDLAPWSALALARMKHLVPVGEEADYSVVRPAYLKVIEQYPGHLAAREAFIYLMATKIATLEEKETREANSALQKFVADTSQRTFLQPAYSLLAVGCNTLGLQRERLDAEIKSLETTEIDPTNPFAEFSWAYWNIATIAEFELGDFDTARMYYRRLLAEYPTDIRKYAAKTALQRMDDMETRLRAELGARP